jgi:RHS repeat-associated protein
LTVDGPRPGTGDTTAYTYNSSGYLATVTDPVGHVTTVTAWSSRGQPTTVVDANGVTTNLTYDIHGRVLTVTIDPGAAQSQYVFAYNAVGDLTKITLPEGGWLQYTYDDGRRLTQVANDRGETQTFTPNAMGDPTAIVVKTAGGAIVQQQSFVYDELGRLIQAVGAGAQTTGFGYDKVDNPTSVTDARGKLYQTAFDPLDRAITQTNPEGQTVQLGYSPSDQVSSHKDGRALETTRVIDGFGQVIQEVSPDRGTRTFWYDEAGNLTKLVDGDGQETDYSYDNAGRLTQAAFVGASAETITYSYDATTGGNKGVGRLTGVTEESGSSAFTYDSQGRITQDLKTIQGRAYTVQYGYDRNGRVTSQTLPSGRTISFARAPDGLVTGITTTPAGGTAQTIASSVGYLPFGPLQGLTYGNGLQLTRSYDPNEWLSGIQVAGRLDLTFGRNETGQLTSVTDNAATGRGATFGYSDSGRLTTASGPWGGDVYAYDAAGNRTDKARTVGGTTSHETPVIAATSNQVASIGDGGTGTLRALTYRTGGDLAQAAFTGGPTYVYQYNARKRLSVVKKDGSDAAWYGYDFQGHRVWRSVFGTTTVQTHYVFDQQGHLLAEHDGATGAVLREYVWLDDLPVALIDSTSGTAQTYFIHSGQLDEPLVMTDATQAKVWDAYVEPFGQAQVFGTPSAGLDARLPGQWAQAETGLSQNWMRDYDPSLGRYIEADPLGVEAGQNVYAYVHGDPLGGVDVQGLAGIGHNGPPPEPLPVAPWLGRLLGALGVWAIPTPLNHGEDELICREHFKIPTDWKFSPSKKGGGYRFSDPRNPNNNIRVMPGDPNSPNTAQQQPYVKYQKAGQNYDRNGNPVQGDSAAAHIPLQSYNPSVMPK